MIKKEFGSDFHYISNTDIINGSNKISFFDYNTNLYFSGRVAFRAILIDAISKFNIKKLYVPTYYCHEVYHFVSDLNIELEFFDCNPINNNLSGNIDDLTSNAILVVNYYGLGTPDFSHLKNVIVLEDLTHDLDVVKESKAHYVFGSLRKILPLPVGGFVYSKEQLSPLNFSGKSEEIAIEKLCGMWLKKNYLQGDFEEKKLFRELLTHAEECFSDKDSFASLPVFVKEYLSRLCLENIVTSKENNSIEVKNKIKANSIFELLTTNTNKEFALILKFCNQIERDKLRNYLIENNIFPMILWPNQITETDVKLENTFLFIHIDFRYTKTDINFIIEIINKYTENAII